MLEGDAGALAKIKEIYRNRDMRAKELRNQDKNVIGYYCAYVPLEFLTAAGLVPYRIVGNTNEPITRADTCLETVLCPYMRSTVDLMLKGAYDFLDGVVVPYSCGSIEKIYLHWRYYFHPKFSHFLDIPRVAHRPGSYDFLKEQLRLFRKALEEFVGEQISDQALVQATQLHNQNRALVRELYELTKQRPPLLSGTEVSQIICAAMAIPVEECNELLVDVIAEVRDRQQHAEKEAARLLLYGCPGDDATMVQLIEECGANVVIDDLCFGTRFYWHDVELTDDPLDGFVSHMLDEIKCPRTAREPTGTHKACVDESFGYLRELVADFAVDGVVMSILRFCDIYEFDVPDLRDYLEGVGVPVLHLEHDYSAGALMPLKTRIEAFLEMVG